jgi:transposase InsO family protein
VSIAVTTGEDEAKWYQEDQIALVIIQSSLDPSIHEAYSHCESAKQLWESLKNVYGNLSNLSRVYEVKKAINNLKQEEMEFTQWFGKYRSLWAELDMLRPSTVDPEEISKRLEQDRVFGMMMNLNPAYGDLVCHLLRQDKLPSLDEACGLVQREQGSKMLFGGKGELAMVNKASYRPEERKGPVCEHCKRRGHTKERCYTLHPHLRPSQNRWDKPKAHIAKEEVAAQATTSQPVEGNAMVAAHNDYVRKADLEELIKSINALKESGNSYFVSKIAKPLIVDSGASHHMISSESLLQNLKPAVGCVSIADGKKVPIKGIGDIRVFDRESKAFFMPTFKSNLLSVHKTVCDLKCKAIFDSNKVCFQDIKSGQVIGEGTSKDGLYLLEKTENSQTLPSANAFNSSSSSNDDVLWHARLGHPHSRALNLVLPNVAFKNDNCEACILGKHCRSVFPKSSTLYENCFDLVHSDVWSSPCASREHHKYFVTFIDEKSKFTWVTLLTSKDKVFEAFTNFQTYVFNQYSAKVKILRTDNGGEYTSQTFKSSLARHGIIHQTTCPYTPQQNGVAERKNRHLMEVARSMMFHNNVPKRFWNDAVVTACYLINRIPTKVLNDVSPFEVLTKTKPPIDHLRVFGCVCYVFVPGEQRNKLEAKSIKGMFIGYSITQKGYKCYIPDTRRVIVSRDVKFMEGIGFYEKQEWSDLQELSHNESNQARSLRLILERIGIKPQAAAEGVQAAAGGQQAAAREQQDAVKELQAEAERPQAATGGSQAATEGSQAATEVSQTAAELQIAAGKQITTGSETTTNGQDATEPYELSGSDGSHGLPRPTATQPSDLQIDSDQLNVQPTSLPNQIEETVEPPTQGLRRSQRVRKDPSNWINTRVYYNNLAEAHPTQRVCNLVVIPEEHQAFTTQLDQNFVPQTYDEAKEHKVWRDAVENEHSAMVRNHTWDEAELPLGKKAVTSRWLFTIKYNSDGTIERHKSRLVARGFTQTYGEDYHDTFAPVAKLHTVRVVLSLATNLDWDLWQMDVKNAFLQGELEDEVYMHPPPGLEYIVKPGNVLRLRKAIYGLKQSPRAWYHKLSHTLRDHGFHKSEADHTLFTLQSVNGIVVILVYVDDIIITGSNKEGMKGIKEHLHSVFDIKDLGEMKYFLGIEICRSKEGLFLSQRKYTLDLLHECDLGSRKASTPLEDAYKATCKGENNDDKPFDDVSQYRRMVGKLIYLTITRPDICFAVNQVSQHMQVPKMCHWAMVDRILRYLKGTPEQGIWMGRNESTTLVGYCDADWAGDRQDRKSTTGYCTFLGGNLVTWKSKKQKVVSCSSAEAEYRAMRKLTDELIWLKQLLKDLGVETQEPITMHCDNQAAIHIASNSVFHERTKHIEVDCHKVREKVEQGVILPCYTRSSDQLADIFTKAASTKVCEFVYSKLGLCEMPKP